MNSKTYWIHSACNIPLKVGDVLSLTNKDRPKWADGKFMVLSILDFGKNGYIYKLRRQK